MTSAPTLQVPSSYASLPLEDIRVSHYPESSAEVTPIIVVTLYRPNNYNAFSENMMLSLERVFPLFSIDDRVKCIVVTGHGRMFCAGADLQRGFGKGDETENEHRDGGGRVTLAIHQCTKPTIGAIQGPAVGVGITMTLPFCIRVALRSAKIGFVFARRGLVLEAASSYFLPRLVGLSRAMHLVTTGGTYRADDPLFGPLFTEFADTPEAVLKRALELAEEVVANVSGVSLYMMREMLWRGCDSAEATHLLDSRVLGGMRQLPDNNEGVRSFMEKRPAKFTGTLRDNAPAVYPWWQPVDTRPITKAVLPGQSKL